jgi:hypothetical protein
VAGASGARRIVLNRAAFDQITLAAADGAFELAKAIVLEAAVPDATPLGQGLIEGGGVVAYVGSKRVGMVATAGATSVKKPRRAKLGKDITVVGGFGFPARFVETGTIHMAGHPFLTPQLMATLPDAEGYMQLAMVKHRITTAARRAKGDFYKKKAAP